MKLVSWALAVFLMMGGLLFVAESRGADFYVATNGSDSNPGTLAQPFASPTGAQHAVRALIAQGLPDDVTVYFRGGKYYSTSTWSLTEEDSGTDQHSVTYRAYPNEVPIISGMRNISGWVNESGNVWSVMLPDIVSSQWWFSQLYFDDKRQTRARWPNDGELYRHVTWFEGDTLRSFSLETDIPPVGLEGRDVEACISWDIWVSRALIASGQQKRVWTSSQVGRDYGSTSYVNGVAITNYAPWLQTNCNVFLENSRGFMDAAGEWYLERTNGKLTYLSFPGEDPSAHWTRAPLVRTLLAVNGSSTSRIRNVRFMDLVFDGSLWLLPTNGINGIFLGHDSASYTNYLYDSPVALAMTYCESCSIIGCTIKNTGASAIGLGPGSRNNTIRGCDIFNVGVNGVVLGWHPMPVYGAAHNPWYNYIAWNSEDHPSGNQVLDNHIHRCGEYISSAAGVMSCDTINSRVINNLVDDLPYKGIFFGMDSDPANFHNSESNIVEANHIRDVMMKMTDGGAIHTYGWQDGTTIRGNLIHHVPKTASMSGWNCGIYLDNSPNGILAERNIVYDTPGGYDLLLNYVVISANCSVADNHLGDDYSRRGRLDAANHFDRYVDEVIAGNEYARSPTTNEFALASANTGPRFPYCASLGLQQAVARQAFDGWQVADDGAYTNNGWLMVSGNTVTSREPCVGMLARLTDTSQASIASPASGLTNGCICFFRRNFSNANISLIVEFQAAPTTNWQAVATNAYNGTNWISLAYRLPETGQVSARIRRQFTGNGELAGIDAIDVSANPPRVPSLSAVAPPDLSTLHSSSMIMSVVPLPSYANTTITGVYIAGAAATPSAGVWNRNITLTNGWQSFPVQICDSLGSSLITTVSYRKAATHYVSATSANPISPYTNGWASAATQIQQAIAVAAANDLILVSNGAYAVGGAIGGGISNRVAITNSLFVRSVNGATVTAIVGSRDPGTGSLGPNAVRCVYINASDVELSGFTLTNGCTSPYEVAVSSNVTIFSSGQGGAVLVEGVTHAVISNCVVVDNIADGIFTNQSSSGDQGYGAGGGICVGSPTSATVQIIGCAILRNTAVGWGGGVCCTPGAIDSCLIQSNRALGGGGVFMVDYQVVTNVIRNSIITGNIATNQRGGGILMWANGNVEHCMVTRNTASSGGGGIAASADGGYMVKVVNSIVYSNTSGTGDSNVYAEGRAYYYSSCIGAIIPLLNDMGGNINADPKIADPAAGDFRLAASSPCIDDALPLGWAPSARDYFGDPRIVRGFADMGADEWADFQPPTITAVTPTNNFITTNMTVMVTVNVLDDPPIGSGTAAVTVYGIGATNGPGTSLWYATVGLVTGVNLVLVNAADTQSNVTVQTLNYVCDIVPPTLAVTPSNNFVSTRPSITITNIVIDSYMGAMGVTSVTVNGKAASRAAPGSSNWLYATNLVGFSTSFVVSASDQVGNKTNKTVVYYRIPTPISDFDGDGKTDKATYNRLTSKWSVSMSLSGTTVTTALGSANSMPVVGDYDGDGLMDYAALQTNGSYNWTIKRSSDGVTITNQFGYVGVVPVQADYDGDYKTDLAVWDRNSFTWYISRTTAGFLTLQFGFGGCFPVPGDYDGDRKADIAVYSPTFATNWYMLRSTSGFTTRVWGYAGTMPVQGDYDADSTTDIGVFDPYNSWWYVYASSTGAISINYGFWRAYPTPSDYDGDRKTDLSLDDIATATWYVRFSATTQSVAYSFGGATNSPVLPQYQINKFMGVVP